MAEERYSYIGARLKSAVKNVHVTGTEDVFDDTLGKTQKQINDTVDEALYNLDLSITGTNIEIVNSVPSTGTAGKIYRYVNSGNNTYTDYMFSGGSRIELATHDTSLEQAQIGYYVSDSTNGAASSATKKFVSSSGLTYNPNSGGEIKILMTEANTHAEPVYLQFNTDSANTKKKVFYNGEAVSDANSWGEGEVISVYYDGSYYQATNAQGGSRKIDDYLYGESRVFDIGKTYVNLEAVKTVNKQLLTVKKDIYSMALDEEIAVGDLRVYNNNTYQAQSAVKNYTGDDSDYESGDYAIVDGVVKSFDGSSWTAVADLATYAAITSIWGTALTLEELTAAATKQNYPANLYDKWGINTDGSRTQKSLFYDLNDWQNVSFPDDYIQDRKIDGTTGKWSSGNQHRYYLIPVEYGQVYRIIASESTFSNYAWFKSVPENTTSGGTPPYAPLESNQYAVSAGTYKDTQVPRGARYMYVFYQLRSGTSYVSYKPYGIRVNRPTTERIKRISLPDVGPAVSTPKGCFTDIGQGSYNWFDSPNYYGVWTDVTEYAGYYLQCNTEVRAYAFLSDLPAQNGDVSGLMLGDGLYQRQDIAQIPQPATEGGKVWLWIYTHDINGDINKRGNIEIAPEIVYPTAKELLDDKVRINALEKDTPYTLQRIINLARKRNDSTNNIGILHYSDLHQDVVVFKELHDLVSRYGNMFNDILETGDRVYETGTQTKLNLADKVLFTPGNHDVTDGVESYSWASLSQEYCFNQYFAPYIEARGITMPTGYDVENDPHQYAMYWYKDYNNGIDKVRLIGIDCMHYYHMEPSYTNDAQEKWLCDTLEDAQTNGYKVMIACHYPLDDFNGAYEKWSETDHRWKYNYITDATDNTGGIVMSKMTDNPVGFHRRSETSFSAYEKQHLRERPSRYGKSSDTTTYPNNFGNIITAWIEGGSAFNGYKTFTGGGVFIAWICGHVHKNMAYYPALFPKILTIATTCVGTIMYGYNTERPQVKIRQDGVYQRLSANAYFIQGNYLKIVRIGNNLNTADLVPSTWMVIDYTTGEVISEG